MQTIHLARHLRTVDARPAWLDAAEHARSLVDADDVPLAPDARPDAVLIQAAAESNLLVSSTLRRGIETVARLEERISSPPPTEAWPELREARLPPLGSSALPLPRATWDALARVAWFLGRSAGVEPVAAARLRARAVVGRLERALTSSGSTVTVVGHGCMNVLIARELAARGFRGPRVPSLAHGAVSHYVR